jgi:transposase
VPRARRAPVRAAAMARTPVPAPTSSTLSKRRALCRHRNRIEDMLGRLKAWRRIHTRYDRCAHTFMSDIALAATVIFWLRGNEA